MPLLAREGREEEWAYANEHHIEGITWGLAVASQNAARVAERAAQPWQKRHV